MATMKKYTGLTVSDVLWDYCSINGLETISVVVETKRCAL